MEYLDTTKRYPSYSINITHSPVTFHIATPDKVAPGFFEKADELFEEVFGRKSVEQIVKSSVSTLCTIATVQGEFAGIIFTSLLAPRAKGMGFNESQRSGIIEINNLAVLPEYRNLGIGKKLLEIAVNNAYIVKGLVKKAIKAKTLIKVDSPGGFNKAKISRCLTRPIVRASFQNESLARTFKSLCEGLGGNQDELGEFLKRDYTQVVIEGTEATVMTYQPGQLCNIETIRVYDSPVKFPEGFEKFEQVSDAMGEYSTFFYKPSIQFKPEGLVPSYQSEAQLIGFILPRYPLNS
jgi:GNAT superfamily N-acetyltransferase